MIHFFIDSEGMVSTACRSLGYTSFEAVGKFVRALPYGRNVDKSDPLCLIHERCGTCSTKHLFLKRLAMENRQDHIRLIIGLYRLNAENTANISDIHYITGYFIYRRLILILE